MCSVAEAVALPELAHISRFTGKRRFASYAAPILRQNFSIIVKQGDLHRLANVPKMYLNKKAFDCMRKLVDFEAFYLLDNRDISFNTLHIPFIGGARPAWDNSYVLLPVERQNVHWRPLREVRKEDIPFEEKFPKVLWRGRLSGSRYKPGGAHRARLLQRHLLSNRSDIDVKPTRLDINEMTKKELFPHYSLFYLRSKAEDLEIRRQLQSRYLICVEGNDVATSLKWMLFSNSTVFMPIPTSEDWALQQMLIPWKHYIPIRYDFSDIADMFEWCETDGWAICRASAYQGKNFMTAFLSPRLEHAIMKRVLNLYARRVHFYFHNDALRELQSMAPQAANEAINVHNASDFSREYLRFALPLPGNLNIHP